MIVKDSYGNEHELEDTWDQDFEFVLPWLKSWGNMRMHPMAVNGKKRKQKDLTKEAFDLLAVDAPVPCTVVLYRVKTRGELDDDNVPDAFKYVRDEIARWLGHKSDRVPGLRFLYGQLKTSRPDYLGVRVTIYHHAKRETDR